MTFFMFTVAEWRPGQHWTEPPARRALIWCNEWWFA